MIQVRVKRDGQNRVKRVLITGHADYGEYGKDIVCAAVSGISIGMVNAIEQMFGVQVHRDDDGDGKIDCFLPDQVKDPDTREKIGLLLEAMVVSLENVAEAYSSYVRISEWKS
ncbi:ribosomal-processing cysteine protease Prp [Thermoactinomyces intermedius]|jgi:uncharacterized protein YsxB (DUF464 family)|uniref:Ribosomal processing cysteine protease Prp n=1 Tax=Thermoactinomyces intermedius TaxID=2024 RepID=A0A8I1DE23_THEIN|nr:ribosomal-processing cysteine protease Prp [Thermoactinomyces intermedius]MBA4548646.1 ribosomal-processing cysteine protease Prp [Thermoactinomyces intermedius]MBA4836720.1 ribosomal-processing cysteine protease Prp [Thermoactinomyces intermedius]MBH8594524.1 ribosomal-processing cysteine protease Prp [Thermoactinomyces intermedius]